MMKIPPAVVAPVRFVPPFLLSPLVSRVFFQVIRAHPGLFERLGSTSTSDLGSNHQICPSLFWLNQEPRAFRYCAAAQNL